MRNALIGLDLGRDTTPSLPRRLADSRVPRSNGWRTWRGLGVAVKSLRHAFGARGLPKAGLALEPVGEDRGSGYVDSLTMPMRLPKDQTLECDAPKGWQRGLLVVVLLVVSRGLLHHHPHGHGTPAEGPSVSATDPECASCEFQHSPRSVPAPTRLDSCPVVLVTVRPLRFSSDVPRGVPIERPQARGPPESLPQSVG